MTINFTRSAGMIGLAFILILWGLAVFIPALAGITPILGVLAIIDGILILLGL